MLLADFGIREVLIPRIQTTALVVHRLNFSDDSASMADGRPSHSPLAVEVVEKLQQLNPSRPEALDKPYCGTPHIWIEHQNSERIGGTGICSPNFMPEFKSYFNVIINVGISYLILDQHHNRVASKHDLLLRKY
ncbi:hypothetical protein A1F95_04223 [Pyrenophora tritici-repentis]|nr:hypothetical protein PtrEW13061_000419 [Pyrenophora tritici-repentis]PWO24307.1 hypothetical protein PtrARCrB10_07155 [Pyrenophora tritici-repentis]PZC98278.1 hypothetical protein A1F95_04223 [Pyrenophora tritici-repentis]